MKKTKKTPYIESKAHKISKWLLIGTLLATALFLMGCAQNKPASETIANSATQSINAIENTLTPGCKTKAIQSEINAVKSAINATVIACENEKEVITQEKVRWKWAFWSLAVIVLSYFAKKALK